MHAFRVGRILTMDAQQPEIRDGGILVCEGRIAAIGPWRDVAGDGQPHDLGPGTLVPGVINAHTHLGLSHLAGRIPRGLGFPCWADRLFSILLQEKGTLQAAESTLRAMRGSGTCFVADVVAGDQSIASRALEAQGMAGLLFQEFAGQGRKGGAYPKAGACPAVRSGSCSAGVHALYSTSAVLAQAVKRWCVARGRPFTLHLAEVPGENELFLSGSGPLSDFLRARRILPKDFSVPQLSAVAFAQELGLLDAGTLAVHCVQVAEPDVEILVRSGASVCLCPRSNEWIGVGRAPAHNLHAAGIPLCLGTDSPASNADMDLWGEVRAARSLIPSISLAGLLAMVTRNPARALGIDRDYGSLEAGKKAVWATLPADLED